MELITLDEVEQYVWPYEPDWGAGVVTRLSIETERMASLTQREVRRALGRSLRVEMEASFMLGIAEAAAARNALRVMEDAGVRLPFFPAIEDTTGNWDSAWWLAWNSGGAPGSAEDLYWTDDSGDKNGRELIAPTLLGHFAETPEFSLLTTETCQVKLRWRESSPYAARLQVAAQAWTAGPAIGARAIYLFPYIPDFRSAPGMQVSLEVERKDLGFGRQTAASAYPQVGGRQPAFGYTLSRAEAARLVRFFEDRQGPVEPFWLPGWLGECRLVADLAGDEVEIEVTDAAALGDHRYLLFYDGEIVARKIVAIAGNVLTLESATGRAFSAEETVLCSMALARFASAELELKWASPEQAECEIKFAEVAEEYATPAGETYAESIGPLAERAFLYELRHGAEVWRWTSFEAALNYAGNAYESRQVEHGEITDEVAWETNKCAMKCRTWANHPLHRVLYGTLSERLELIIGRGVPSDPVTGYEVIFRGWITTASFEGPWITAQAESFGTLFSRQVPRTLLQPTDNFALFDSANGLLKADWTFSARLTNIAANVLTLDTLSWTQGDLPAMAAEYFAMGYVERPAASFERIPVVSSTALAGGALTVTLARALIVTAPALPEVGWSLIPGYDGLLETAEDKFDNATHFGGFHFMPADNPSLVAMQRETGGSSKK